MIFSAPELDIYARRTEAQLINKDNPEAGLFIAESPKVIGRALDAGYIPVSALVEKHQMEENEETRQILTRFEDTDVLSGVEYKYSVQANGEFGLVSDRTDEASLTIPKSKSQQ